MVSVNPAKPPIKPARRPRVFAFPRLRVSLPVVLLVLWSLPARAQEGLPPLDTLDAIIPALMQEAEVPGLSIAVIRGGEVAYVAGFGVRSTVTDPPVDAGTVFEAASLSKPVFAYAVLQIVDAGLLDLDRPLAEYLPYDDIAHDPRYRRITARMVLSHTSGFPNWRPKDGALTLAFEPGTQFSYSGEGYVYLQKVVEHLTGKPMHRLLEDTVLKRLGMTESGFIWEERFGPHIAVGHREDGTALDKFTPTEGNAAWSLHTTAPDYARFLIAVMNGEGLSTATRKDMLSPQADAEEGIQWGLGWGLQRTATGRRAFWHWGDNFGYKCFAIVDPGRRAGMVYFTNSNNGMLILHALLAHTMGGPQPAADWLGYDRYDDPQMQAVRMLYRLIEAGGVETALARYHEMKAAGTLPPAAFEEAMLNTLGYRLLRTEKVAEAIAVFKLNAGQFPDSYNVYDSLGEAYMVHGDFDLAIASYERSIQLEPGNDNGRQMLERLRAAKAEAQR